MKDTFLTIAALSTGEYKDRGSKFIACAFPLLSENDWQIHLEQVQKEHPKARHHCYAWRTGLDGNQFRANDDGEPSGTAGRPILGQIDSFGLTNVLVVVVRYFGGTLLGTSGLIQAYKMSTQDALQKALILEKQVQDVFRLTFDYASMSDVMGAVKKLELSILQQEFGEAGGWLDVPIRQSEVEKTLVKLKAHIAKITIEEAETLEKVEGLVIEFLHTRHQ
ncbi:MAG: YigZ family protein [Bacteroidota bacterium]